MDFELLREAVDKAELVDGHAHNIVAEDSDFPFIHGFSEAQGDALLQAVHSLSFKVSDSLLFSSFYKSIPTVVTTLFYDSL